MIYHLLQDATFWTAVSFVLFVALIVWKARSAISGAVHGRIERIRTDLENAEKLRDEAQAALAELQRRQRETAGQARDIVERARSGAAAMKTENSKSLVQDLARRKALAAERISRQEADVLREIRVMTAELSAAAARRILTERLSGTGGDKLLDDAITRLPEQLQ